MLSYEGFRTGLQAMGVSCATNQQFQAFVNVVDDNKSGNISYEEFLRAVQEIKLTQLFNESFVRSMTSTRVNPAKLGAVEYSPDRIRSLYPISDIRSFIYSKKPDWASVRWINIEGLNKLLIRRLSVRYCLQPLAVKDTLGLQVKRQKNVKYEEHSSLVLHTLHPRDMGTVKAYQEMYRASQCILPEDDSPFDVMGQNELESRLRGLELGRIMTLPKQLSLYVMKGVLISVQASGNSLWPAIKQRLGVSYSKVRHHSTAFLVYTIMDVCVDELSPFPTLLAPKNCSKQVKTVQTHCKLLFEVISKLILSDDYKGETLQYFADVQDQLTTIKDECEQHLDRCRSLLEGFNNARAAQQNDASYILALIAAIFLPAQFLTGVYGMNFPYIPETTFYYGYFIWWRIILLVAGLIVLLFKLKKWL
ncbi:hypothetical protein V7S43_004747 [Phytophthora oleae]|uniref:EF-hand domain-containing protein n=1 Tax=Phytophthora oleae TaxID=2107226 RepID=A0ABD3FZQ1_9STRA